MQATLHFFKAISQWSVSESEGFMSVVQITLGNLSYSHLPPWYQGFDIAGTKMSARAQKARVAGWAMVSSGLEQGEQASANIGVE